MKKLVLCVALASAGWIGWRSVHRDGSNAKLLYDRFWIDHEPRDMKETFQAMFVSGEHPVGQFATRTVWTGAWEGFHYHVQPRHDGKLVLMFPASQKVDEVTYTVRPCSTNGFDFCLEIDGASKGVKRYYSKKEWGSHDGALPQELQRD